MAATITTFTPGTALQQQVMWETNYRHPEQGVHRVTATLYYAPHDEIDAEEQAELVGGGISNELVDYQWETECDACIYPARADGSFISNRDNSMVIFARREDAVNACIETLQQRIAEAQTAMATLRGKEAR